MAQRAQVNAASANTMRRLLKELKATLSDQESISTSSKCDIYLQCPDEDDLFTWRAWILGPPDTPYADAYFELSISIPATYPLLPPSIAFVTRVFHPNVHFKTGEICLDLLKNAWSPVFTLQSVCRSIVSLLAHPEPDSPLNCDCGNLLRSGDVRGYRSLGRMYTRLYASPTLPVT